MPQAQLPALKGRIVTPTDADYDELRTVFLGQYDRRPAFIARVASDVDVSRVIDYARTEGLEIAVRSGGHSYAGHSTTDGGVLIDLRDLTAIDIDLDTRTAWASSGLTTGEVAAAVEQHGLIVGFGDTGSVGIGGITLGGGIGYLVRKHGLTIDNLLAAEIVCADGKVLRTDAENHPDLFWAIRGGGGNFGVGTRFKYALHDHPSSYGGSIFWLATPEVIDGFIAAAKAAPEELSAIANVMPAPPMPFVPEEHVGKLIVMAAFLYAGDVAAGEKAMAPFRGLAEPLEDGVEPMRYSELAAAGDASFHPVFASRTMFAENIDARTATRIVDMLGSSTASMRVCQLRVLGGAMARVPADATAFAHRSSQVMVTLAAFYEGDQERVTQDAWLTEFARAIPQSGGAYVNFLGEEGAEGIERAYPQPTLDRLAEAKRRYDPTNLFRRNQNVAPAPG
ncbi:MAG: FAD-binding oxidoreductase [Coriobacteriales bacterium]|nr:FAD-binding oxidoreductase [Coriobacteriales bacterium]